MPTLEKAVQLTMHERVDNMLRESYQHLKTLDDALDALRPCGDGSEAEASIPSSGNIESKLSELSSVLSKIGSCAAELNAVVGSGRLLQAQAKAITGRGFNS
jgi:hypothetical protein